MTCWISTVSPAPTIPAPTIRKVRISDFFRSTARAANITESATALWIATSPMK